MISSLKVVSPVSMPRCDCLFYFADKSFVFKVSGNLGHKSSQCQCNKNLASPVQCSAGPSVEQQLVVMKRDGWPRVNVNINPYLCSWWLEPLTVAGGTFLDSPGRDGDY